MYIDQTIGEVKPYTYAAVWEAALHEAVEQFVSFFFRDAYSCVRHLDTKLLLLFRDFYLEYDFPVGRSVFERVWK